MRSTLFRAASLLCAAALLLALSIGCAKEELLVRFEQGEYSATVGEPVQLELIGIETSTPGCSFKEAPEAEISDRTSTVEKWKVDPSEGASVSSSGVFTADEPGEYTVSATVGDLSHIATVKVASEGEGDAQTP
ncbi:MAG: hypothetical protein JXA36_00615 [Coriobacteriia bacterium]|nr:hypothetical protein [Coriobacteriia bacterium]